jgi:histidinol-phosphatase (PHP family)
VIVDYHMHLREPAHSEAEGPLAHGTQAIERYVEEARRKGVDEIGFAEHLYYFRQFESLVEHPYQRSRNEHDLDDYCDAVLEAKRQGLPVKLGLEVEYYAGRERELADLLAPYPWDYLLGAVHVLDGEMVDIAPGLWGKLPVEEVWRRYFVGLRSLARSGLVDVLAHPDLVKIFRERPSGDAVSLHYEETADAVQAAGVAVEVSTAGLRKPVRELYPDRDFLAACRLRGVAATTASDAHAADDVGRDFDRAVVLLREAGYETVTVFDARRPRQVPLAYGSA